MITYVYLLIYCAYIIHYLFYPTGLLHNITTLFFTLRYYSNKIGCVHKLFLTIHFHIDFVKLCFYVYYFIMFYLIRSTYTFPNVLELILWQLYSVYCVYLLHCTMYKLIFIEIKPQIHESFFFLQQIVKIYFFSFYSLFMTHSLIKYFFSLIKYIFYDLVIKFDFIKHL